MPTLRDAAKALGTTTAEAAIKVVSRIGTQAVPAISADVLALLLGLGDLFLELRGARVDELEL